MSWHPTASLKTLGEAAKLRCCIRDWMQQQLVMEVVTPALSQYANTDPHVQSIATKCGRYLHTSPEFHMKRLLTAHAAIDGLGTGTAPDLYQMATVFRAEENGRHHNSQFTLLEWYRNGMDHHAMMDDLSSLLRHLWQAFGHRWPGIEIRRYGEEVQQWIGLWPEQVEVADIAQHFATTGRSFPSAIGNDVDAALDLFVDEFVLPCFPSDAFTLLIDYPVAQAALARVGTDVHGRAVARRFELYFGQLELANGFHELNDVATQRERFEADLARRETLGIAHVPMDEFLLDALAVGLPDCAGIALGVERLHMVLAQHKHIREVLSFDDQRA